MMPNKSSVESDTERFVQQLAESQGRLFGYIYSLVGDHARAADVVQETNLVLWRKLEDYDTTRPFLPWAMTIARYQVLAHVRDRSRDRSVLSEEIIDLIAEETVQQVGLLDAKQAALKSCLMSLKDDDRMLVEGFYFRETTIADLAERFERNANTIKVTLMRIRRKLAECVRVRLAAEGL